MKTLTLGILVLFINVQLKAQKNQEIEGRRFRIAYNIHIPDTSKDDWEIMLMNPDGSDKANITGHPDVAWTYIANNDLLYFISDRDTCYRCFFLYECDATGNKIRKVSSLRLEDSFMSLRYDGSEMIVAGRIGSFIRYQLFLINLKDGSFRQLTSDTAAYHADPCFSPDGKKIVFSYKKNRRNRNEFEELYIMDEDGKNSRQLTHYPKENPSAGEYGYRAGASRWHPTENFISYVSKQDGRHSIFAITPDGSKQWKLIDNPESEGWHDWSRDGKWLVFNNSDKEETQYHITLVNWVTKKWSQLTDNTYKSQLGPVFIQD